MKTASELLTEKDDLLKESHDVLQEIVEDMGRMVRQKYGLEPEKYSTYIKGMKCLKKLKIEFKLNISHDLAKF